MIGLSTGDEADLEDAARIGNRVYVIGSHGRNKDGKLERARYRFFGMDLAGTGPSITLTVPGYTTTLLDQMLVAANWTTPNTAVIATLTTPRTWARRPTPPWRRWPTAPTSRGSPGRPPRRGRTSC